MELQAAEVDLWVVILVHRIDMTSKLELLGLVRVVYDDWLSS